MNQITFQDIKQPKTTPSFAVGQKSQTPDGNVWVYVKASEAIAAGNVVVSIATKALAATTLTSAADASGKITKVIYSTGGLTVDAYAGKYLIIDAGTGAGQIAKIKSNDAGTLTLYPEWALTTALAAADSAGKIAMGYDVEKAAITDKVQMVVGIAQNSIAKGEYAFVQTQGTGFVVAGEALVVGKSFVTGDDTEGQVVKGTTAKGSFDENALGHCLVANGAADQPALVFINIA
jgi:hypothetical protein